MKAYVSQFVYAIKCDGRFTDQYDEQFRLVYATNKEEALAAAKLLGEQNAQAIVDRNGRTIFWEMLAIKDIREVNLDQGSLLSSAVVDTTPIVAPVWEQAH